MAAEAVHRAEGDVVDVNLTVGSTSRRKKLLVATHNPRQLGGRKTRSYMLRAHKQSITYNTVGRTS